MRRICCFCESWGSGGIESFLKNVLCAANLADLEVDIVSACIKKSVFADALKSKGVHFIELSGKQKNYFENFRMFQELLRRRRYDVIHFNLFQGLALFYVRIAQQQSVPVRIAHCHVAGLRNSRTKLFKLILHRIGSLLWSNAATDYWACSSAAASFMFPRIHKDVTVIPNGIDTQRFRFKSAVRDDLRKTLGLENEILIGTVGRMSREKNQKFALDIFSKYHQKYPDSHFVLVGDGEEREALKCHAQQLGIEQAITFLGTVTDVEQILYAMDLFLFPSCAEGLGIAVVEAQASGLPVLCSDQIPVEAKVTNWLEALPLSTEADVWSEKISQMLLQTRLRETGADAVRSAGFDVQDVAKQVERTYMRI